jgi:hypothetical protein
MKARRSSYARPVIRSEESSAPRRGLAGRATEQLAGRAGGSLALAGGPPPSRHGCQVPQALSTGAWWGGPARARWAWWPGGAEPAVPSSACRCPRPASGVQCLVWVSSITRACPRGRCAVRASERPDVRCPAFSVGVRCPWVPASTVSGSEVVEGWRWAAAAWLGWPASAWSPDLSTASSSAARVGTWRSRLAQVCWVSGGVGLGLASWEVVGQWLGRPRGRQDWLDGRGDCPLVASRGAQRGGDYATWSSCGVQGRVAWSLRASWAGLRRGRAAVVRPQHAVSAAC